MSDELENLIQFDTEFPNDPPPFRAARTVPDWLKNMPMQRDVPNTQGGYIRTVKNCLPFLDAMNCGYVIPLRSTVHFFLKDRQTLEYHCPDFARDGETVGGQPNLGFEGAPFGQMVAVKFINHWVIKTPPGYSTLFLPLLNQFHLPFQVLSGLVDTDTYYRDVFLPAICLMQPGTRCVLERGTPLVQVVPFKRETWRSANGQLDIRAREASEARARENVHHYRDTNWQKKEFR